MHFRWVCKCLLGQWPRTQSGWSVIVLYKNHVRTSHLSPTKLAIRLREKRRNILNVAGFHRVLNLFSAFASNEHSRETFGVKKCNDTIRYFANRSPSHYWPEKKKTKHIPCEGERHSRNCFWKSKVPLKFEWLLFWSSPKQKNEPHSIHYFHFNQYSLKDVKLG